MKSYKNHIEEQLLLGHSKVIAQQLQQWIGNDAEKMDAFMQIFLGNVYRLTQRGAWVLGHISKENPLLLEPWLPQMLDAVRKPDQHVSVRRNVIRHFDIHGFPDYLLDDLADICFGFLENPNEAIAVRIFSMGVLYKICTKVPELQSELVLLIEEFLPHGSAGFKSRGKKIVAKISKNKA